jgi:hypothetical protein
MLHDGEVAGLLALMLLTETRWVFGLRDARPSPGQRRTR